MKCTPFDKCEADSFYSELSHGKQKGDVYVLFIHHSDCYHIEISGQREINHPNHTEILSFYFIFFTQSDQFIK